MREVEISADQLVRLLASLGGRGVCLLDSCGVGRRGANLLIAGIDPVQTIELFGGDPVNTLLSFNEIVDADGLAAIFTLSYDFGLAVQGISKLDRPPPAEPNLFAALFDGLVFHDYDRGRTWLAGSTEKLDHLLKLPGNVPDRNMRRKPDFRPHASPSSNFTRGGYLEAVKQVKELIRAGETYQTNLTQQITVPMREDAEAGDVFLRLRRDHPAAFAAYLDRGDSTVVSASPEQFIRVEGERDRRIITASPIKGTRPRGRSVADDERLRQELSASTKDRAENTMIVDLMRNDLGRICEFGSVSVGELCRIQEHPTLFHLESTVNGLLRPDVRGSDIITAAFPCGSITGAPKIRTMEIIDRLESVPRGLSMGAIGCRVPGGRFGTPEIFEMSVAIRTMVIRGRDTVFNVGGGIVIDSDPMEEYEESILKSKALLNALEAGEIGDVRES